MKYYVAELVSTGIDFLCALTNHAGACFVWRRLMWLDNWADDVMQRGEGRHPHVNPAPVATYGSELTVCNCNTARVGTALLNGSAVSYRYCPAHGMVRES